ncbi:DUF5590 domain-containing protein [Paenibacillus sp. GYB004]|uniref:cell wall elongation regulator TseB-like domain-containing protein n=1 Tax=Paenibacillus sp. GYB004 TaxID=2994393 RepID=UPI002F962AD1
MARKIALWSAAVLAVVTIVLVFFYRSIHEEEWAERLEAKSTVIASTYMRTVDRVERFVGEKPYMVVFGQDEEGREAIAWVNDGKAKMRYASTGITAEEARRKVEESNPDNEVLRVLPGVLNETYLWEVFYKRKDEEGSRYYYSYYRFDNGEEIDTWRMSRH